MILYNQMKKESKRAVYTDPFYFKNLLSSNQIKCRFPIPQFYWSGCRSYFPPELVADQNYNHYYYYFISK